MANSHQRKVLGTAIVAVLGRLANKTLLSETSKSAEQSGQKWKWPLVSFAGGVGMTALAFLMQRSPTVVLFALALLFAGFAYPAWAIVNHFYKHRTNQIRTLATIAAEILVLAFTVFVGIVAWPKSEVVMSFTNSTSLSNSSPLGKYRRFLVSSAAEKYRNFLVGIGFDIPRSVPIVGVSSTPLWVESRKLPDIDEYKMAIPREHLGHPNDITITIRLMLPNGKAHFGI
jgi:hypothetical protein